MSSGRMYGIMAVDPGVTTGLAWGRFDLELESVGEMLAGGEFVGWAEATGTEEWQAARIVAAWREFDDACKVDGIPSDLVVEDFILRPGRASADREMLAPVRLTALIEGILLAQDVGCDAPLGEMGWELTRALGTRIVLQPVSSAKSFATRERLERWGAWKPGMRHARDAWRHIALRLASVDREVGRTKAQ